MPITDKDPYTAREAAQIIRIGIQIQRREARGKPTKALENKADRIREIAQEREDARIREREERQRQERLDKATRRERAKRIREEERKKAREAAVRKRAAEKAARRYR